MIHVIHFSGVIRFVSRSLILSIFPYFFCIFPLVTWKQTILISSVAWPSFGEVSWSRGNSNKASKCQKWRIKQKVFLMIEPLIYFFQELHPYFFFSIPQFQIQCHEMVTASFARFEYSSIRCIRTIYDWAFCENS